jgi:hypothetical protein
MPLEHAPSRARANATARDAASHRPVGKRTLVEAAQRRVEPGERAREPDAVKAAAAHGTSGPAGALPHLDRIQRLFGRHEVSGVRAHVGGSAAEGAAAMGAQAFATGAQVAFATTPDLHTAAHEAAHVVQQRDGVQLNGGVGEVGDAYERHADEVADLVARGESAESVLDRHAGTGGGAPGVQRRAKTHYGEFTTEWYDQVEEHGVDIKLEFHPGPNVDATKIGLTQQVRSQLGGGAVAIGPTLHGRMVPGGEGEGSQIDRMATRENPIYGAGSPEGGELAKTPTRSANMETGFHYQDVDTVRVKEAWLTDGPELEGCGNDSSQVFETAALALEGRQQGSYLGSVQWGWQVDGAGQFKKLDLKVLSGDVPTGGFMAAARQWNASRALGTVRTNKAPTPAYDTSYVELFKVDEDTEVTLLPERAWIVGSVVYNGVRIEQGDHAQHKVRIRTEDLTDQANGTPQIHLPIQAVGAIIQAEDSSAPVVRAEGASSGGVLAELPVGARVKCLAMAGEWWHVELDTTQHGVVLKVNRDVLDKAAMLRGHVHKRLIKV